LLAALDDEGLGVRSLHSRRVVGRERRVSGKEGLNVMAAKIAIFDSNTNAQTSDYQAKLENFE
jgi:hypothetical protein